MAVSAHDDSPKSDSQDQDEAHVSKKKKPSFFRSVVEFVVIVVIALALATGIRTFIAARQEEGLEVCWVGIGASTNLARVLSTAAGPHPNRVVVMCSGTVDLPPGNTRYVETNVRLDPTACLAVFAACEALGLPLAVLPLDTTGYLLTWHKPRGDVDLPGVWTWLDHHYPTVAASTASG